MTNNSPECFDGYCGVPSGDLESRSEKLARRELRRQRAAHRLGAPILQLIELIKPEQQPQQDMEKTS